MTGPVLVLDRVSRQFGGLKAVDAVSLSVGPGERHALIGPNGAGKTTLFNLISGECPPTEGRIEMFGTDVTGMPAYRRATLGVARTFQITKLFPALTVQENLLLACAALDARRLAMHRRVTSYAEFRDRASQLMDSFGLAGFAAEAARNLSYGDQRKLEVALSMARQPRLLLLDEPMAGLSAGETRAMHDLLDRIDRSVAVLLIEHDMDVAFTFAERVTVLHQGRVMTEGNRDQVSTDPRVQQIYLGTDVEAGFSRPGTHADRH